MSESLFCLEGQRINLPPGEWVLVCSIIRGQQVDIPANEGEIVCSVIGDSGLT